VHLLVSEQYIDSIMHGATIKVVFPDIYTATWLWTDRWCGSCGKGRKGRCGAV